MRKAQEARLSKMHRKSEFRHLKVFESSYTETENKHGEIEIDLNGNESGKAWFYWFCLPGCLPDSEPLGPFKSIKAALDHAEQLFGE